MVEVAKVVMMMYKMQIKENILICSDAAKADRTVQMSKLF